MSTHIEITKYGGDDFNSVYLRLESNRPVERQRMRETFTKMAAEPESSFSYHEAPSGRIDDDTVFYVTFPKTAASQFMEWLRQTLVGE